MRAMAFRKIAVLKENGLPDGKSYIAAGDWCHIADKTLAGLYPVTYPTARGNKTRWLRRLEGFLCNQNQYVHLSYAAPGYENATIKSGGCGVCAAVNAVGALTGDCVPVREMRDVAKGCGARVSGGTHMGRLTAELCRRWHLQCQPTNSITQLTQHLQQGGVAICNTAGRGMFSTGGHYVTALGIQGGKVCIADSGLYIGKYSSARRKAAVSVSGDLLFAAPAVLDADCVGRSPRYYLLRQEG